MSAPIRKAKSSSSSSSSSSVPVPVVVLGKQVMQVATDPNDPTHLHAYHEVEVTVLQQQTTKKPTKKKPKSKNLDKKGTVVVDETAGEACELIGLIQAGETVGVLREYLQLNPSSVEERSGKTGMTPLHAAARRKDGAEILGELLKLADVDVEETDHLGDTALFTAVQYNAVGNVAVLLEQGQADAAHVNKAGLTVLHEAVRYEAKEAFQLLLDKQALGDINVQTRHWTRTVLNYAFTQKADVATFIVPLLEAGADATLVEEGGKTGLDMAVSEGADVAALLLLLLAGKTRIDVNHVDKGQFWHTSLNLAVLEGKADAIGALLAAGADATIADRNGQSALELAIAHNDTNTKGLAALLAKGSTTMVNATTAGWWRSALNFAITRKHVAAIELLLAAGADPLVQDDSKQNALELAVLTCGDEGGDDSGVLATLLQHPAVRAVVNAPCDGAWKTVLNMAIVNNKLGAIHLLLGVPGIDPSLPNKTSHTAVDCALLGSDASDTRALEAVLAHHPAVVDVNKPGPGWWRVPLHLAIARKRPKHLKLLVDAGAALDVKTEKGQLPAQHAKAAGFVDPAGLLK